MSDFDFHFIDKDDTTWQIILSVLELVGNNFAPPYAGALQPLDGAEMIAEELLQLDFPAGILLAPDMDTSTIQSMSNAISSAMTHVAGFLSFFSLLLPIIGVIRGILEVICCIPRPICLVKAIIKLFKKWLPPFISLFPPIASIVIFLSIVKLIFAVFFHLLSTVLITIKLVEDNLKSLGLIEDEDTDVGAEARKEAIIEKLDGLITEILNQIGLLSILKPIIETAFAIASLVSGFPCEKDSDCCDEDSCLPEFESPPQGNGVLAPLNSYKDFAPSLAWQVFLLDGFAGIEVIRKYSQNPDNRKDDDEDESDTAPYVGQVEEECHFNLKITGPGGKHITSPILNISRFGPVLYKIIVLDPDVQNTLGISGSTKVKYEIVPNWNILLKNNIISAACHPDIASARDDLDTRFGDLSNSALSKHQEIGNIKGLFDFVFNGLHGAVRDLRDNVNDRNLSGVEQNRDQIGNLLQDAIGDLTKNTNNLLKDVVSKLDSEFDVDKNIVTTSKDDTAVITITPKDRTGTKILRKFPKGVSIPALIETDFGEVYDQKIDHSEGTIVAKLRSSRVGQARVKVKLVNDFIYYFDEEDYPAEDLLGIAKNFDEEVQPTIKVVTVKFVSGASLPKRRLVSKTKSSAPRRTSFSSEGSPGKR